MSAFLDWSEAGCFPFLCPIIGASISISFKQFVFHSLDFAHKTFLSLLFSLLVCFSYWHYFLYFKVRALFF